MNNYTLESFINFCDDMQIAEEGINFKAVLNTVGRVINYIITFIRNIPSKISSFISKKFQGNKESNEYKQAVEKQKTITKQINESTEKLKECNDRMKEMQRTNENNVGKLDQLQKQAESIAQSVINSTKSIDPELQSELQSTFTKNVKIA